MKKIIKISFLSLLIASSCMAATTTIKNPENKKVVTYNTYYPVQKPNNQKQKQNQNQKQITNIKIIVVPSKAPKKIIRGCKMDNSAPIAPYIDNY